MRVLHTGNLANNSYKLAKFQQAAGIDARLQVQSNQIGTGDDPAWEDAELKAGYPDWIEIKPIDEHVLRRKVKRLLAIMSRTIPVEQSIDILHAQCTAPIIGQFQAPDRLVSHCLGSDLRELAFETSVNGWLMRRALRHSRIVFFNNVDHWTYLDRLGLEGHFLPNPLDLDKYRPGAPEHEFSGYDFVVFHPVGLDWTYTGSARSSTKGNDRLIRAFARFVRDNPGALLICQNAGVDVKATKALVGQLAIDDNVRFIDRLDKAELPAMMKSADIVADQFDLGAFGGVALEALACGRPLLTYLNFEAADRCYSQRPPILNARSEDEILEQLVAARAGDLSACGQAGRTWIEDHHEWRRVVDGVSELYATQVAF